MSVLQLVPQNISFVYANQNSIKTDFVGFGPLSLVYSGQELSQVMHGHYLTPEIVESVLPSLNSWLSGNASRFTNSIEDGLGPKNSRHIVTLSELPTDLLSGYLRFGDWGTTGVFLTARDIKRFHNILDNPQEGDRHIVEGLVSLLEGMPASFGRSSAIPPAGERHSSSERPPAKVAEPKWELPDLSALGVKTHIERSLAGRMIQRLLDVIDEELEVIPEAITLDYIVETWAYLDSLNRIRWSGALEEEFDIRISDEIYWGDDTSFEANFRKLFDVIKRDWRERFGLDTGVAKA